MLDAYFTGGNTLQAETRSRSSSMDSQCSDYSDVYEIHDESMLFDDLQEETYVQPFEDCMSYNPYVRSNCHRGGGKPIRYKLMGVVHHSGTGCGGHYVCFRRVMLHGKETWMMFNDIYVKEVQWKDVNTKDV